MTERRTIWAGGSVRNATVGGERRDESDGRNQSSKQNAILKTKGGSKSANAEATYGIQRQGHTRNPIPLRVHTTNLAAEGFLWDRRRILTQSTAAKFRGRSEKE